MTLKIKTPEVGNPIYIIRITKDSDILGSIQLENKKDVDDFKNAMRELYGKKGWGSITIEFDTEDE